MADSSTEKSSNDGMTPKFFKGQRIFAKDETSGILYEAIIRRTMFGISRQTQDQEEKEEWHCFVHYLGWNVSWDRWVPEGAIYELTNENRELAKKLQQAVKDAKKKHGPKSPHVLVELAQKIKQLEQERRLEERREELARQGIVMQEQDGEQEQGENSCAATTKYTKAYFKKELALREQDLQGKRKQSHAEKLVLPFSLKRVLVEEWEVITQCGMLPTLPVNKAVTVRQVLGNYLESKIGTPVKSDDAKAESIEPRMNEAHAASVESNSKDTLVEQQTATLTEASTESPEADTEKDGPTKKQEVLEWKEMVDGIALLFDQAVASRILYRQELPLHEWILQHEDYGKLRFCQVYGCEHLLRLFVRIPALLADHFSDAEARPIFAKLNDFVRFLQKHQANIFQQTYEAPKAVEEPDRKRLSDGNSMKRSAKRARKAPSKKASSAEDVPITSPIKSTDMKTQESMGSV